VRVDPEDLPEDLRQLCDEVGRVIGSSPLILDITTDLDIPAFCAVPSQPTLLGVVGTGASLDPGYALERALAELVQLQVNTTELRLDEPMHRKLAKLAAWPVLARCVRLGSMDLAGRSRRAPGRPRDWWDPPEVEVAAQVATVVDRLAGTGRRVYRLRWNPASSIPVISAVVPGLETFFLSQQAMPVLPTGRAAGRLAHPAGGR
jgi:ribosomal protein S12 methylthiotransferase accessory factor